MKISTSGFDSLGNDLNDLFSEIVKDELSNMTYDVECPHCRAKISVEPGNAICPVCGKSINVTIDTGKLNI